MDGETFKELRKYAGFSLRELSERWDVGKSTIQREEEKDEVRGLYRDAIVLLFQDVQSQLYEDVKEIIRDDDEDGSVPVIVP